MKFPICLNTHVTFTDAILNSQKTIMTKIWTLVGYFYVGGLLAPYLMGVTWNLAYWNKLVNESQGISCNVSLSDLLVAVQH